MNDLNLQNPNFRHTIDFLDLDNERGVLFTRLKLIAKSPTRFERHVWLCTFNNLLNSFQRWFCIDHHHLPVDSFHDLKYFDNSLTLEEFYAKKNELNLQNPEFRKDIERVVLKDGLICVKLKLRNEFIIPWMYSADKLLDSTQCWYFENGRPMISFDDLIIDST